MRTFIQKLEETHLPDVILGGKFRLNQKRLETLARKILEGLLRVGQLHFNLRYDLTILGTTIKTVSDSSDDGKKFILRANRTIRDLKKRMGIFCMETF